MLSRILARHGSVQHPTGETLNNAEKQALLTGVMKPKVVSHSPALFPMQWDKSLLALCKGRPPSNAISRQWGRNAPAIAPVISKHPPHVLTLSSPVDPLWMQGSGRHVSQSFPWNGLSPWSCKSIRRVPEPFKTVVKSINHTHLWNVFTGLTWVAEPWWM